MSMVFITFLVDYCYIKTFSNIFGSFFQFIYDCIIDKNLTPVFDTKNKMIIQRIYRMRTFIKDVFHRRNNITIILGYQVKYITNSSPTYQR